MSEIGFEVVGINGVNSALAKLAEQMPERAARSLNKLAEITMTDAKKRTPVQYGVLRRSGHVAKYARKTDLTARLAFGTEYAIWVHERTELRHKVGEAKFLEHAIQDTATFFREAIAFDLGLR